MLPVEAWCVLVELEGRLPGVVVPGEPIAVPPLWRAPQGGLYR